MNMTIAGDFLVCALCSKNIRGELKMAAHMSKCHPDGQERAPCEYCGKVRHSVLRIRIAITNLDTGKPNKVKKEL